MSGISKSMLTLNNRLFNLLNVSSPYFIFMADIFGMIDFIYNQFKKDLKLAQKRGYDLEIIKKVITALANGETLEAKYRDHLLTGDYGGYRECHIQPDWLLVYQIYGDQLILFLARTGAHSDLF